MWSETASIEGAPPGSAEPRGWGISVSKSGEIHLSAVNTPNGQRRETDGPAEMCVLPEPAVRGFNASRNLARVPAASFVIGYTDPCQNPSAVRFGSSRARGGGLGQGK